MPIHLRLCRVCKHRDFSTLMVAYATRAYRHTEKWRERCDWWRAHPAATLQDAIDAKLPGVSWKRETEDVVA